MTDIRARTVKGFCEAYGVGKTTAFALIKSGAIKVVRGPGARTLVLEDSARAWLRSTHVHTRLSEPVSSEPGRTETNVKDGASDGNN